MANSTFFDQKFVTKIGKNFLQNHTLPILSPAKKGILSPLLSPGVGRVRESEKKKHAPRLRS